MDYITDEMYNKLFKKRENGVKDPKKFYPLYWRLVRSFVWDDLPAFQTIEKDTNKAIEEEGSKNQKGKTNTYDFNNLNPYGYQVRCVDCAFNPINQAKGIGNKQ